MKHPPEWFVRAINILDPLLSVRWGDVIGQWIIERKGVIPQSEIDFLTKREARTRNWVTNPPADASATSIKTNQNTWYGVSEELISAKQHRRIILFTQRLDNQIYEMLVAADMQRYGGYARFADEIEAKEDRERADAERVAENKRHAFNLEVADMMHFVWRKKETELLSGHRNMNYLLHGKESNRPLIQLTDV